MRRARLHRGMAVGAMLTLLLVGFPIGVTLRVNWQEKLDRAFIAAIRRQDNAATLDLLARGADPNAREAPNVHLNWLQVLSLHLHRQQPPQNTTSPALLLLFLHRENSYDQPIVPNRRVVKALLDKGANPNEPNWYGTTPLHLAAYLNDLDTVKLLLAHKANPNIVTGSEMWTPLQRVIGFHSGDSIQVVRCLLEAGADPNLTKPGGYGGSALGEAVDDENLVQLLLQYHADPNCKFYTGMTLLQYERTQLNNPIAQYNPLAAAQEARLALAERGNRTSPTPAQIRAYQKQARTRIEQNNLHIAHIIEMLQKAGANK